MQRIDIRMMAEIMRSRLCLASSLPTLANRTLLDRQFQRPVWGSLFTTYSCKPALLLCTRHLSPITDQAGQGASKTQSRVIQCCTEPRTVLYQETVQTQKLPKRLPIGYCTNIIYRESQRFLARHSRACELAACGVEEVHPRVSILRAVRLLDRASRTCAP